MHVPDILGKAAELKFGENHVDTHRLQSNGSDEVVNVCLLYTSDAADE